MEVSGGEEEGFIMEWTPCSHMLNLIPARVQTGLFSSELCLTCIDAVSDYIALGTNIGLVYWYDRKKGNIQRLRCENSSSPITFVKIVNTVDYMVGAGNAAGQVTVFQIPKEHPENIPDNFKPKVEPKVERLSGRYTLDQSVSRVETRTWKCSPEGCYLVTRPQGSFLTFSDRDGRYTIGNLHKSQITSIEWSKNGMRLFSGDKNGVIIMTEIDFYMHLCKSSEIVNEEHEIVQLSWCQNTLLVSSVYRSIMCEKADARWHVRQVGKRERKSLCRLGAVFQYSYARGGEPAAYVARPGQRLWRADKTGEVQQTLLFKDAIANPLSVVELLNPATRQSPQPSEHNLSALHVYRDQFLVAHDDRALFVLDPRSLTAAARLDNLRRILSVSVNKDEVFVLEGARSVVRLGHAPEPAALHADDPVNLMTKSLSSSIQHAVNTVRDLTNIDQTVPFITSVLEQPMSMLTKNEFIDTATVSKAEECFELPPIKPIPADISENVLESIINEFRDVSAETEALRRAKAGELEKKLKMYNSIMERKCDAELIHSSRRSRRREGGSGASTPRHATPVRRSDVSYTTPTVMNVSVYSNVPQEADDILEKQIEEKEKILAKMLNLESLSIKTTNINTDSDTQLNEDPPLNFYKETHNEPVNEKRVKIVNDEVKTEILVKPPNAVSSKPIDLVPKLVKLPNNWNLGDIELQLDLPSNGVIDPIVSPDEHIESEWEFV